MFLTVLFFFVFFCRQEELLKSPLYSVKIKEDSRICDIN